MVVGRWSSFASCENLHSGFAHAPARKNLHAIVLLLLLVFVAARGREEGGFGGSIVVQEGDQTVVRACCFLRKTQAKFSSTGSPDVRLAQISTTKEKKEHRYGVFWKRRRRDDEIALLETLNIDIRYLVLVVLILKYLLTQATLKLRSYAILCTKLTGIYRV